VKIPTLALVLLTAAMSTANAVIFPLWTGYTGGRIALPPGIAGVLPYLSIAAVNAISMWLLVAGGTTRGLGVRWIFALAVFTRLAYLVTRTLIGTTLVDQDIELFFGYGRELAAGQYPGMEYPQGALLLFTVGYMFSDGNLDLFRTIFPLLTLPFDLITIGAWVWLGKHYSAERTASALCIFYGLSPFTLVLWYGKYDVVPAALLALGVCLFIAGKQSFSALILGIGLLTKWFPGIAIPFFLISALRTGKYGAALKYGTVAAAPVLFVLAVSWLVSPEKVLLTYAVQSSRPLMGESLLYLPAYLLEANVRTASTALAPWDPVKTDLINNTLATWILLISEGLVLLCCAVTQVREETTVGFAGLGVAVFIIMNRVYSPQYIIVLFVVYALGFISLSSNDRGSLTLALTFLTLSLLNYLIWPVWSNDWLVFSALFFALNLALVLWLGFQSLRAARVERKLLQPA
jgi:hypothetical protein